MARMNSSDKACLAKMSNPKLPAIAEPGKCFAVIWADGRGIVGFRKKKTAQNFIKEGRESVQAVYGPNDKKLKLK